ncbi:Hint domain-containing protein [Litoreibacter ponti]|uniref:Hint domain-containing protein n=1 Tax=Litoreibacter ponti TaxID=1510457 RepID=A0A2T6BPM4_9RHOB|nr:Hint domain-containing protein [Litoreibacter ponti]PTX58038.1 Hint domain-containing protein [Litoreibacter ponti]
MKRIELKLYGHTALLGRAALSQTVALQANNGRDSADNAFLPSHANINQLPSAVDGTGLMAATRIATPFGPRRVDELSAGDLVLNADGQEARVCHVLTAPAPRDAYMVRAPYYGLDQDAFVGPNQQIVVTSDIAEYLFGEETVMVPVWALSDSRKVLHAETRSTDLLYQVQLDSAAPIKIGNCAMAALHKDGVTKGRALTTDEARCFATEHRLGFRN